MKKKRLIISTARTDEPKCVICGKDLGEKTVCYAIDPTQYKTIPLCAECLQKASELLRNTNRETKLIKIRIYENHCIDGKPYHKSFFFQTTDDAKTVKNNITKSFYDHIKKEGYKTLKEAQYDGFYFGNQFTALIPTLKEKYNLKQVHPDMELEADFDTIFE